VEYNNETHKEMSKKWEDRKKVNDRKNERATFIMVKQLGQYEVTIDMRKGVMENYNSQKDGMIDNEDLYWAIYHCFATVCSDSKYDRKHKDSIEEIMGKW